MRQKIWMKLFEHVALVLIIFAFAACFANLFFLDDFFSWRAKVDLAEKADVVLALTLDDEQRDGEVLAQIEDSKNIFITIYDAERMVYSTMRSNRPGISGFDMLLDYEHSYVEQKVQDYRSGQFYHVTDKQDNKLFVYAKSRSERTVVLMLAQASVRDSAAAAARFSTQVLLSFLVVALFSSVIFARRFSRPIIEMNKIAKEMTALNFSKRVQVDTDDEIGQLAGSINELSVALSTALDELNERNAKLQSEIDAERRLESVRRNFVASVSHELKTPISIIHGYTELLEAAPEDRREQYCQCILSETERMHELVIRLLELSRIEGEGKVELSDVDATGVVVSVLDGMSTMLNRSRLAVKIDMPERLTVHSDRFYLRQAVQNFVSNAIAHTPEGGQIRVYAEPYEQGHRLCVYNSGSHINDEELERVWQSFYRGDQSHNRDSGRFGLGLSIVRACMQSLGCDYGLFNTQQGVCFWVELKPAEQNCDRPELPENIGEI